MNVESICRSFDPAEHYFWLLDQSSCMNFVVFAEIDKQFSVDQLQNAFSVLSENNALLRTSFQVSADNRLHFRVHDTCENKVETYQTNESDWLTPIEAELSRTFSDEDGNLVRCLMVSIDNTDRSIIAMTFHHSLADGKTGVALLKQLLICLDGLGTTTGDDLAAYRETLSPGLHQLFSEEYQWEKRPDEFKQLLTTRREELKRSGRPSVLANFNSEGAARQAKIQRIVLSKSETTKLLDACKANDCSVHGALAAAQLFTLQQSEPGEPRLTLSLTTPADMRAYIIDPPSQKSSELLGLYISMLSANYRVEPDTDFWQLAKEIGRDVKRHLRRGDGHLLYELFQPLTFSAADQDVQRFTHAASKAHQNTLISNLGNVTPVTSTKEDWVRSISFALCPMPSQTVFAAVSTYKNQLYVNLNFDIGKMPEEDANHIRQQFRQIVTSLN